MRELKTLKDINLYQIHELEKFILPKWNSVQNNIWIQCDPHQNKKDSLHRTLIDKCCSSQNSFFSDYF